MMKKRNSKSFLRKTVFIFPLLFLEASFQVMAIAPVNPCVCADNTMPRNILSNELACGAQCQVHKGVKKMDLNS